MVPQSETKATIVASCWENKENSKVKSPFRRFSIRPVLSSYTCEFMDDVFDKLKKNVLGPVWLDDQKLIPESFPKSKNYSDVFGNLADWKPESVWDKNGQPLAELKLYGIWLVCPNVTYIFMFARKTQV